MTRSNAWPGPADFVPPELPDVMWERDSLWPTPATVFEEVGEEVLLLIVDPTDDAPALASLDPFQLQVVVGSVDTPLGALGYAIFAIPNPPGGPPYAAWERFFDAGQEDHVAPLAGLADQTHWHVVILGAGPVTLGAYEFVNDGSLTEPLEHAAARAAAAPLEDIQAAVAWAQGRYELSELYDQAHGRAQAERQIRGALARLRECVAQEDREAARAIGQAAHDSGGFGGMRHLFQRYVDAYGDDGAPRVVEMWWSGVGEWLG